MGHRQIFCLKYYKNLLEYVLLVFALLQEEDS